MKNRTQYTLPGLMLLSQLLLLSFVLYWLNGQYNEEKKLLHKDLKQKYEAVENQLIDSLLMIKIVHPVLDDTSKMSVSVSHLGNSESPFDTLSIPEGANLSMLDTINAQDIVSINIVDTSKRKSISIENISKVPTEENEILVKSIRLLVNSSREIFGDSLSNSSSFSFAADSAKILQLLNEEFSADGYQFPMQWIRPENSGDIGTKELILSSNGYKAFPSVQVNKLNGYLLLAIFPEIGFTMLLLLLTGAAFYFTYRSLIKMQRLGEMRDAFIGNITHELKTPVSTMKVALEAIKGFSTAEDYKRAPQYLQMAQSEANRLENLINHILSHSKMEANKEFLSIEPIDLNHLIIQVLDSMQLPIEKQNATVSYKQAGDAAIVNGDRLLLESVLRNIVDNALKYGGQAPEVALWIEKQSDRHFIHISDKGPGIPEKYIDQVFDKFFRVPQGNIHNVKGYGLGLSYAHLIMNLHKGQLNVKNLEEGCVFTLTFCNTLEQ